MTAESNPRTEVSVRQLVRTTFAGTLGTTLEYYDYVIYGLATALVFNKLFYTNLDPAVGLVAGFATYAVGFVARPIGGLILGAIGDRIGRKFIMMLTIVLMGLSTFAIGLLPTYDQVGLWAPALLVLCRIAQGFGAGAELSSSSTLLVETSPVKHRGFIGSFVSFGTNGGSLIASGVWLIVSSMPEDALLSWGWRVPFLFSIVVAAIGVWVRRHVRESKVFESIADRQRSYSLGRLYLDLFRNGWRSFLICFGLRIGEGGTSTLYQAFLVGYVATIPHVAESTGALALLISSLLGVVSIPLIGIFSDKVGRRTAFLILAGLQVVFALPGIALIETGNMWAIIFAFLIASGIAVEGMYGVESPFMVEMFGSKHRLIGVTASKELGGLAGAGVGPLIVAALLAAIGQWWIIGAYIGLLALIGFIAALCAPEVRGRDLTLTEDAVLSGPDRARQREAEAVAPSTVPEAAA